MSMIKESKLNSLNATERLIVAIDDVACELRLQRYFDEYNAGLMTLEQYREFSRLLETRNTHEDARVYTD